MWKIMEAFKWVISKEEVEKLVENRLKTTNFTLLIYTITPIDDKGGSSGDYYQLNVNLSTEKLSYFLKLCPRLPGASEFIESTGAFKKELFVYEFFNKMDNEGISLINHCVAKCFFKNSHKMAMENLREQNYQNCNKQQVVDYRTVKTILYSLANLHACSLIYEEKQSQKSGKPYRLIEEYSSKLQESYFNRRADFPSRQCINAAFNGIERCTDIFHFNQQLRSGKQFKTVVREVCEKIFDEIQPSNKFRNVLSHGDLWASNFMVRYNDQNEVTHCKLVDFQLARYAPPSHDVMALLHLTTSREFRLKYMYDLIGFYYNHLEKNLRLAGFELDKILSFSDFLKSCEEQKLVALVIAGVYLPLVLLSSETIEEYFSGSTRGKKAMFEDRTELILDQVEKDEDYSRRLNDSIRDLRDFCEYY